MGGPSMANKEQHNRKARRKANAKARETKNETPQELSPKEYFAKLRRELKHESSRENRVSISDEHFYHDDFVDNKRKNHKR